MEKLKKMISPGHGKDDEVMYGDPNVGSPSTHEGASLGRDAPGNSSTLSGSEATRPAASAIPSHMSAPDNDASSTVSIRSGVVGSEPSSGPANPLSSHSPGVSGQDTYGDLVDRTLHQHAGPGHRYEHPEGAEDPVPGYVHHIPGPHATDMANRLDPHIPGEFPTSPGVDSQTATHGQAGLGQAGLGQAGLGREESTRSGPGLAAGSGLAAGTAGGLGALGGHHERPHHESPLARTAGFEEQRFDPTARSHQPSQPQSIGFPSSVSGTTGAVTSSEQPGHGNFGRDAALGGAAAGVGAAGAYEATRHTGPTAQDPATYTTGPHANNVANILDPRVQPEPRKMTSDRAGPTSEDPASFTTGHHKSNLANIVDPRVQPEPEKMKDRTTTGPHQSDAMNRADPRVAEKEHHYGRDAALVGGAGAAGAAAYGATRSDGLEPPQAASQPLATPTGAPEDARIFDQTQFVPDSRQADPGWAADTKAQEKLQKEQAKEHEKAQHKAEKEHEKAQHKSDKAYEKALKNEKEKERAERAEDKGEKKHGLFSFLHRDKSEPKDTAEERDLQQQRSNLSGADHAGAAGGFREDEEYPDQRVSTDDNGRHKLHKEPPPKVQRELEERAREQGTLDRDDGIVTEPHTGLPMNVGKYGSGHGGTDGSDTIPGYQSHQG